MFIVVMTGATSGIGKVAAEIISSMPNTKILIGARNSRAGDGNLVSLDLNDLRSVRAFNQEIVERLNGSKINALLLNAGVNVPGDDARTADGFEVHFGVNHLAHFLILRELSTHLALGARVIITTADAHDPERFKMAPPETADAKTLAYPPTASERKESAFKKGFRAYASSKLCNILTTRALANQPETQARGIISLGFNPSFTPDTLIGRNASPLIRLLLATFVPLVKLFVPINTARLAGESLAGLAVGNIQPPAGQSYASLVKHKLTWPQPSVLARNDSARDTLWKDSALLVEHALLKTGTDSA